MITSRDITEQRASEERLLVAEKMSALGLLVSGVAHELNNPLTGVLGFSELLCRLDGLPERARRYVEKIHKEAGRGRKIVQNLLTFARHRKPERQRIDINEVVEQVLDLRSYEMRVNNIEVTRDLGSDLPPASGDPHQLQQVFVNIVHNAEQAMVDAHDEGRLQVHTSYVESRNVVRITFEDDGPGMTREQLAKAFDPFFTTKPEGIGTGLGLAISHGIVVEHGGTITARTLNGRGARFTVELPVSKENDLPVEACASVAREIAIGRRRILVVDDEPCVADLVRDALETIGHSVVVAFDGGTALERLRDGPCDGVICDLRMPGMSGVDLYLHCRENRPELARRFLFMSGDIVSPEFRKLPDGEMRPHLPKPFRLEQLEAAVHALFSGTWPGADPTSASRSPGSVEPKR